MIDGVKDILDRAAGWYDPSPVDPDAVVARAERQLRRSRLIAASVALAVFAFAGLLVWSAFGSRPMTRIGIDDAQPVTASVNGIEITYPSSWTLTDLWPLSQSLASWPEPIGTAIDLADDVPERGGLPLAQLSNDDLGLSSGCGVALARGQAVLYVALNGGPYRVTAGGAPVWSHELERSDGPCGEGWYAYREASEPGSNGTTNVTPYLVFAGFGADVSAEDRDAIFGAFDSMILAPFDHLRPPVDPSPRYVTPTVATPNEQSVNADFMSLPQPPETHLIASGSADAGHWEILAYELEASTSAGTTHASCLDLDGAALDEVPADEVRLCAVGPLTEAIGATVLSPQFRVGEALVFGEVRGDVASVAFEIDGRSLDGVEVQLVPPPASGIRASTFVALVPSGEPLVVVPQHVVQEVRASLLVRV